MSKLMKCFMFLSSMVLILYGTSDIGLAFDLIKAFDQIDSSHKLDFLLAKNFFFR